MRLVAACGTVAMLICFGVLPGHAEKRVALVIGNDRYAALPQLRNAVADARLMAETLRNDLQFKVFEGENLDYRATNRLHADFEAAIGPGDTAFVFFAGHGVALGAENYLLPTDTEKPGTGEENLVRSEAHAVDSLIRRVQARGAAASFFMIDACRDNPFEAVGVRSIGNSRGLARADVPTGVFVLFSAGIGQTALDRLNDADRSPNSVFTRKLVPLLRQPGLTHIVLAKRVQTEVRALAASVRHQQQPAFYDQIDGEVVFKAASQLASPEPKPPLIVPPAANAQVAVVAPPAQLAGPCRGSSPFSLGSLQQRPPQPLPAIEECLLKPKDVFKECDQCPEMVVVPAGSFTMGSPESEKDRSKDEGPQRAVTIAEPFAVGKFQVTRDQLAAFVAETGYDTGSKCYGFEGASGRRSWAVPGSAPALPKAAPIRRCA